MNQITNYLTDLFTQKVSILGILKESISQMHSESAEDADCGNQRNAAVSASYDVDTFTSVVLSSCLPSNTDILFCISYTFFLQYKGSFAFQ